MTRHNLISSSISVLLTSLLLLVPGQARAQEEGEAQADSIPFFRNVAVSVDALGVGQMLFSDYGQYEATLRVNLKDRWYPVVELGLGVADASDETTLLKYKTSAPYFRVGCDWNLLKNKHDIYRLYGGFRYAFTTFKYDIERESPLEDPVWGGNSEFVSLDNSGSCHWLEACFGVDVKVAGPFRMGWSIRYRRRLLHSEGEAGDPWYVPGFGRNSNSRIGGTFNLTFEL